MVMMDLFTLERVWNDLHVCKVYVLSIVF